MQSVGRVKLKDVHRLQAVRVAGRQVHCCERVGFVGSDIEVCAIGLGRSHNGQRSAVPALRDDGLICLVSSKPPVIGLPRTVRHLSVEHDVGLTGVAVLRRNKPLIRHLEIGVRRVGQGDFHVDQILTGRWDRIDVLHRDALDRCRR